jgi:hypothetical protein
MSFRAIARDRKESKSLVHNSPKIFNSKGYENEGPEEEEFTVH